MTIDQSIFKAYDIRGIYPTQLDEEVMERIGRAFAMYLKADTILVGYDMRLSGPQLKVAFIRGVGATGTNVIDLGQISTDCLYFAAGKYELPGAMITASHNPKEFNGIKFCRAKAEPIGQETGLLEIKELVLNPQSPNNVVPGIVTAKESILEEFKDHCYNFVDIGKIKSFKIAIDAGNAMGGKLAPIIFSGLPCEIVPLYFELDGNFPNHQPSPIEKENNRDLIAKVKEVGADLGLAFDGDADRVFFVDEKGEMIDSSFITAMLAEYLLRKKPNSKIIYTVAVSRAVPEIVAENGGEAIMTYVGHSYIKQLMKETGAIFAGEHSGHYYFIDNYRADSGVIAVLIVLQIMSEANLPISEIVKKFARYARIEETNFVVADKNVVLEKLKSIYGKGMTQDFDGVSFDFGDWRFNVRGSNTEPLLRLNLEAKDEELLAFKLKEVGELIKSS